MSGPYRSLPSRVLTAEVTAAALAALSPAERELVEHVCERLGDQLRVRGNKIGPVYAREIVAAIGRLMVERGM